MKGRYNRYTYSRSIEYACMMYAHESKRKKNYIFLLNTYTTAKYTADAHVRKQANRKEF